MQEVQDLLEFRETLRFAFCNYINGVWLQLDIRRAFSMKKYSEISVCRAGL